MKRARLYSVTYDIPHDGRRVKVANTLKSFGERVQYSVFECWLEPRELAELQKRLEQRLDAAEDSVRIYRVQAEVTILGLGAVSENPVFYIV